MALGEVVMPLVVYWELSGTSDPVRAFELGTAVLIVLLLGDEGHKSLLQLALLIDREVAAKEATTVLADYFAETPPTTDASDGDTRGMHSSLTGASLYAADHTDEEMASAEAPPTDSVKEIAMVPSVQREEPETDKIKRESAARSKRK